MGLGAFLDGWGDRTTKPFGLRAGRLPIFNLPPVSPGRRPFFLGFMRVFGESYLPLLGAIRWSVNTELLVCLIQRSVLFRCARNILSLQWNIDTLIIKMRSAMSRTTIYIL